MKGILETGKWMGKGGLNGKMEPSIRDNLKKD